MRIRLPCMAFHPSSSSPPTALGADHSSSGRKSGLKNRFKRGLHWLRDEPDTPSSSHAQSPKEPHQSKQNTIPTQRQFTAFETANGASQQSPPGTTESQTVPKPIGRTDSERRDKLQEVKPTREERRTASVSVDRKRFSRLSQGYDPRSTNGSLASPRQSSMQFNPRGTATSLRSPRATVTSIHDPRETSTSLALRDRRRESRIDDRLNMVPDQPPMSPMTDLGSPFFKRDSYYDEIDIIEQELEWKWILNLSMHFRERSDREKFFVTYAENPRLRHRITVSCDYRNAEPGSLEEHLSKITFQREKSARIYEAVRDSLFDIQFYDTITNLKLETEGGRLHVHVIEDEHEIIHYPPVESINHLDCTLFRESDLEFDSHLSGFVYKVRVDEHVFIKKEIPGPDTIDEFLYEINALYALRYSNSVIKFGGLVVDDNGRHIRGLLIAYAPNGSLIDLVYNERGTIPWHRRERWARQIVQGLSEIHEAGFVQGDFTMSNMVLDERDDIRIIDINRRGCPIGWEPPELRALIESQQRIAMFIGVKSDLYQLGMVLWGLVHQADEPETAPKPLTMDYAPSDIPEYFRHIVTACLSDSPTNRPSARELLVRFPTLLPPIIPALSPRRNSAQFLNNNNQTPPQIPEQPIDIMVGDGQIIHVSPTLSQRSNNHNTSPTSLRLRSKHLPVLNDTVDFTASPAMLSDPTSGSLLSERLRMIDETKPPPDSPATEVVASPPAVDDNQGMDWQLSDNNHIGSGGVDSNRNSGNGERISVR